MLRKSELVELEFGFEGVIVEKAQAGIGSVHIVAYRIG
jgi:hypothetical protein